jgi:hypothetical protein
MAIYHYSVQVISRSQGRSAVAAAAYRSGEKLVDERTNEVKFYHRDVQPETTIIAPENAPGWVLDRERLWNGVEHSEKRKDAQLCREINVALPIELNHDQQRELIHSFVRDQFVQKGMIADVAIHRDDMNNPHAHIMLTMRTIDENGFGKKNRDWNQREELERGREEWANYANPALENAGYMDKITHLSHEAQGIEQLPTVHLGHVVNAMEKRGVQTERGNLNRERQEYNQVVVDLQKYKEEKVIIEQERTQGEAQKQKLDKFYSETERVELQEASKILKAAPSSANIKHRREQLDKWQNKADNSDQYIRWKDKTIQEASVYFQSIRSYEQQIQEAKVRIEDINWLNPLKIKENRLVKEQAEQTVSNAKAQIILCKEKLNYHREKLGFNGEGEFTQIENRHQVDRLVALEKNQIDRKRINYERDVLQKAETALKQGQIREIASHYPELNNASQYMKYETAMKLKQINEKAGKILPLHEIKEEINYRKNRIQEGDKILGMIDENKQKLNMAENHFKQLEITESKISKLENNPFTMAKINVEQKLEGKVGFNKPSQMKKDYDELKNKQEEFKTALIQLGFENKDDLLKFKERVERTEKMTPDIQKEIVDNQQGNKEGQNGIGLGLLESAVQGIEQAQQQEQREKKKQVKKQLYRGQKTNSLSLEKYY